MHPAVEAGGGRVDALRRASSRQALRASFGLERPDRNPRSFVMAGVPDPQSAAALIRLPPEYPASILVLSARFRRDLAGSAEAARRLGVKQVLPKPLTHRKLLAAVREPVEA